MESREHKSLSQNHVFTFKISSFTTSLSLLIVLWFWNIFWIFDQILRFLINITCFFSFSGKNDAESLCHFVKIPFLDPKRAKLDQNSDFSHVRTYFWLHKSDFRHLRTLSWLHKLRNTQGKIHGWQWNISRKYIWNI